MDIRTGNDIFYKFSLIYRGSHDGISNISFINKCNHRVATLVLIKVLQSNEIFGGYASFGLLGEDISNNFVFSFKEGQTMKIGRAKKERISWREKETYGFRFCESMYMDDRTLYLRKNSYYYENVCKSNTYTIEEIETFIVTK
ncbi:uncharacterized protein OCT59_024062 [Rhizophagus irregularis]|nr:hypothetical protein RirG_108090 [Rhizophagus irregularis DAOM 197198w]UZO03658.1 hypothetical protein OCT59_024062 [Rhizophagus irregularis]